MGFIGGLLGGGGGAGGSGFAGPTGVSPEQLNTAYAQTQAGIQQQQDFVNALKAQNGLTNQSNVFGQLNDISLGNGPNPAKAMLANQTKQNIDQQAALQASQRGSSANAGLIARQAAQQGGNLQQTAAGQAAALQAQQSLNAINSKGNIANTQVAQQQTGLQNLNQFSLQQQGNLLGTQANINNANAQLAGTRMGQQPDALGGLMNGVGGIGKLIGSGGGAGGDSIVSTGSGFGDIAGGAGESAGDAGGLLEGVGEGASMVAAEGGEVPQKVESNDVAATSSDPAPKSFMGNYLLSTPAAAAAPAAKSASGGANPLSGITGSNPLSGVMGGNSSGNPLGGVGKFLADDLKLQSYGEGMGGMFNRIGLSKLGFAKGGKVPALVSRGEVVVNPKALKEVKKGANPMEVGEKIPGKPKYPGNDYRNDVVHKHLESGGVVIPNKITEQPKSVRDKKAAAFVSQYLAQGGRVDGMVVFRSKRARK